MSGALSGVAALVSGGGSGIGLACARRLAADGATITICGRTQERLEAAAAELTDAGAQVGIAVADVTDEGAVRAAVETAGEVRIVVAAAGGSEWMGPIVSTPLDRWQRTVDTNVTGTFLTLKHTAPVMARAGGGSFVAVSSIAGSLTHRWLAPYTVGKAGIEALVRAAADELGGGNVRVNAVAPGLVDTELVAAITEGGPVLDDYLAQMPISRVGTVDDVAEAVRYLAGPESSWVTGHVLAVDGGHHLRRGPDYGAWAIPVYGEDAALRGIPAED